MERVLRIALGLLVASPVLTSHAQRPTTPPAVAGDTTAAGTAPDPWTYYAFPIPIEQGEYFSPDGTLGSFGIGITNDDRHILSGATYFFDDQGTQIVQPTGAVVTYNDDATLRATGILASADIATVSRSGGPCRGCAPGSGVDTPTGDPLPIDWTSPRTARVTVNGQTETLVNAMTGPPLVAPTDFSGKWMVIWHYEIHAHGGVGAGHQEDVFPVKLRAIPQGRRYQVEVTTDIGNSPIGITPPPSDSRLYDITCAGTAPCDLEKFQSFFTNTPNPSNYTLWLRDDNQGGIVVSRHTTTGFDVIGDAGQEFPRAYASGDVIVLRRAPFPTMTFADQIQEAELIRTGPTFDGTWECTFGHCN
jgi:hypothetical protein